MSRTDHLSDDILLRLIDGETAQRQRTAGVAHIETCETCRNRHATLSRTVAEAVGVLRSDVFQTTAEHRQSRSRLEARLAVALSDRPSWVRRAHLVSSSLAGWSTVAAAVVALVLTARVLRSPNDAGPVGSAAVIDRDALPIPTLTPGATDEITTDQLCRGSRRGPEPADPAVRERVLLDYGMAHVPEHDYELDYLITPELGGANDRRNLWPERYSDRTWNAKVKDQLEDLLPDLVCDGKVDLRTAQRDIAGDWVAAYKKYYEDRCAAEAGGLIIDISTDGHIDIAELKH